MATEPRYRLELETLPGCPVPAVIRLRKLLKTALRAFGFRCATIEEIKATEGVKDASDRDRR